MCSKFKVFLLAGCFLLIATTVVAENFWTFHTGDLVKYNVSDSSGDSWVGTMETIGTVTACGKEYWHIKETNMISKDSGAVDLYIRVEEDAAYQCAGGFEIKFLQTGKVGTTWDTETPGGTNHYEIVAKLMNGTLYGTRYYVGSNTTAAGYKFFVKGMGGSIKRVSNLTPNPPTIAKRQGSSGDTLYANFTGYGVYVYDYDGAGSWTQVNGTIPTSMVAAGPLLYATFEGYGLYKWDGTTWTQINGTIPTNMVSAGSTLYATFEGYGLYKWDGTTWTQINGTIPTNMVSTGSTLYATFTGYGLYKWDNANSTWVQLNGTVPAKILEGWGF